MRVGGIGDRLARHMDLFPRCIVLIPERRTPRLVERLQRAVFFLQEHTERSGIRLGIEDIDLAVDLIVQLPADDALARAVVLAQLVRDARGQLAIDRRIVVVVAPCAVAQLRAVDGTVEHLGILVRQPGWRGRCRRAEDDLHAHLFAQIQEAVEELIGEHALGRFSLAPGKLGNTDDLNAGPKHALKVFFPHFLRPVLRVIAGTQRDPLSVQQCRHDMKSSSVC